jgi:hypothetical protein
VQINAAMDTLLGNIKVGRVMIDFLEDLDSYEELAA